MDQEEIEDLDIVSTQIDYHLDVNNSQIKYSNSIIREDDDDNTNSSHHCDVGDSDHGVDIYNPIG